jgi:hypothetical protein
MNIIQNASFASYFLSLYWDSNVLKILEISFFCFSRISPNFSNLVIFSCYGLSVSYFATNNFLLLANRSLTSLSSNQPTCEIRHAHLSIVNYRSELTIKALLSWRSLLIFSHSLFSAIFPLVEYYKDCIIRTFYFVRKDCLNCCD